MVDVTRGAPPDGTYPGAIVTVDQVGVVDELLCQPRAKLKQWRVGVLKPVVKIVGPCLGCAKSEPPMTVGPITAAHLFFQALPALPAVVHIVDAMARFVIRFVGLWVLELDLRVLAAWRAVHLVVIAVGGGGGYISSFNFSNGVCRTPR